MDITDLMDTLKKAALAAEPQNCRTEVGALAVLDSLQHPAWSSLTEGQKISAARFTRLAACHHRRR